MTLTALVNGTGRPPTGWDPDEAAERIQIRARHFAATLAKVAADHPDWSYPEIDREVNRLMAGFTLDQRRQQALDYSASLWGDSVGIAALATGRPQIAGGRYTHSGFRQRFFSWPDERDSMVAWAVSMSATLDVWIAPMLRSDRMRRKGNGLGGRHAWADVDGEWTAERQDTLAEIVGPGTFVVNSGTGRHVYVALAETVDHDVIVGLNQGLKRRLGGDHKWSDESLLRLPGTLNHKPPTWGQGAARPVYVERSW